MSPLYTFPFHFSLFLISSTPKHKADLSEEKKSPKQRTKGPPNPIAHSLALRSSNYQASHCERKREKERAPNGFHRKKKRRNQQKSIERFRNQNHICEQIGPDRNVKHRSISGHVGPRPRKGVPLHLLRHRYRHRHWRLRPRRCLVSLNSLLSNTFHFLMKICENPNVVIMWLLIGVFT